jgi:GMP synthase-like glutamine amidotransferase
VISGSPFSVYQTDHAWIPRLNKFVHKLIETEDLKGPKAVGVCYGHQVAAYVTKNRAVQKYNKGWGVGIKECKILQENALPWMKPFHPTLRLKYNHQDQVVTLPDNCTLLGTSEFCRNEMMVTRNSKTGQPKVFSFQAHIEYPRELLEHSFQTRRDLINKDEPMRAERALKSLAASNVSDELILTQWAINFLRHSDTVSDLKPNLASSSDNASSRTSSDANPGHNAAATDKPADTSLS